MTRQAFKTARKIVVKAGSTVLQSGSQTINEIARDIAHLASDGVQVVLVSSGAVALGQPRLGLDQRPLTLEQKQAAAAAGQPVLVQAWETAFQAHGRSTAQALITLDVTESRRRWLNARATLTTLLECGLVPVVNENDTVATDEIRYGDNDRLAARVAQLIGADLLVLLSDIEGLYDRDPRQHDDARLIGEVETINASVHAMAGTPDPKTGIGTGGMQTKLLAAEFAAASGCATVIGLGTSRHPVSRLESSRCGTWFHPNRSVAKARERWISGAFSPNGAIQVDDGAAQALRRGKSLLPVGATVIDGAFERGDTVRITDGSGALIARGVTAYDAADARRICGCKTTQIEAILGYRRSSALVHTDDIVLNATTPSGG
jgi:glutamate 5-kinase